MAFASLSFPSLDTAMKLPTILLAFSVGAQAPVPGAPPEAYDPSPDFPYGRRNPAAPVELEGFGPFLGDYDQPGSRPEEKPIHLRATYALNGWAVEFTRSAVASAESCLLVFDPSTQKWRVSRISVPDVKIDLESWEQVHEDAGAPTIAFWSGSTDRRTGTHRMLTIDDAGNFVQSEEEVLGGSATTSHRSTSRRRMAESKVGEVLPFGTRNALAPDELRQLDFLIGEFSVQGEVKEGDLPGGYKATRTGHYILDGWGIRLQSTWATKNGQDQDRLTGSILFDPSRRSFRYIQTFPPDTGNTWDGHFEGADLLMSWSDGADKLQHGEVRLRIFDITERSFLCRVEMTSLEKPVLVEERFTRIR